MVFGDLGVVLGVLEGDFGGFFLVVLRIFGWF